MSALGLALDTPDLAEHHERSNVDPQFTAGKRLIEAVGVRAGDRVLDVSAGTGRLAEHVADLVGRSGFVDAVDPLIDDTHTLDTFLDGVFDIVYLNAAFHWFPEKLVPLCDFHRLLKPGGKLGISTESQEHRSRTDAIQQRVLAREPYCRYWQTGQGLPRLASPEEIAAQLRQTGFHVAYLSIEPHTSYHYRAEAAVRHSDVFDHLPKDLRARARREIAEELELCRTAEGIPHDGARIVAIAIKR